MLREFFLGFIKIHILHHADEEPIYGLAMIEELRRHGLEESTELPDHLTHVLRLVQRMEREIAADFVAACVLPALEKMLQAVCDKKNPFENVLRAVRSLLRSQFPEIPLTAPETEPLLRVLV